jgi:DNA-binding transcriptional ArsR family regulator
VLRLEASADDLLHSRFALSPIFELQSLLRHLLFLYPQRLPWVSRFEPAFERLRRETELDLVLALLSRRYGPSFAVPPPRGLAQSIDDDLAAVRAAPLAVVHQEIEEALRRKPTSDQRILKALRRNDIPDRIAAALERAWHELVATDWPHLRVICERDVLHRSSQLTRAGWAAALSQLHPRVRWRRNGIEISKITYPEPIPLGGAGVLLVPSVFVWPEVAFYIEDPWPRAIVYPARGIASLWERPASAPRALSDLLGQSRAQLLLALAEPASTTQLARLTNLVTGSVNDHLRVLHRAGLLTSARAGRSVLYRRTPLGDVVAGIEDGEGETPIPPQLSPPRRTPPAPRAAR